MKGSMMKRMKKKEQPQQEEILQEENQEAVADAAETEVIDIAALQTAAAKADDSPVFKYKRNVRLLA